MRHIQSFKLYEAVITPSSIKDTMTLWHGGNLNDVTDNIISQKKNKWEYGPGLYLTTHYDTAKKYAKGSRKLYQIVIKKGTNLSESILKWVDVMQFVEKFVIKNKQNLYTDMREKYKDGLKADTFLYLTINNNTIKNTNTDELRTFLVDNGVDYYIVDNAYGWHERMIVLFNMDKIISKTRVNSTDKLEIYDLPTNFI